jgi:hypothetical protein
VARLWRFRVIAVFGGLSCLLLRGNAIPSFSGNTIRRCSAAAPSLRCWWACSRRRRRRPRSSSASAMRPARPYHRRPLTARAPQRPAAAATSRAGPAPTPAALALAISRQGLGPMPVATVAPATLRQGWGPTPAATAAAISRRGPTPTPGQRPNWQLQHCNRDKCQRQRRQRLQYCLGKPSDWL